MNIEDRRKSPGPDLSGAYAYGGSFYRRPGERFNVVLGGSSLNRNQLAEPDQVVRRRRAYCGPEPRSQGSHFNSGLPGCSRPFVFGRDSFPVR